MTVSSRQTISLAFAIFTAAMLLFLAPKAWGQAPERIVQGPDGARYIADELIVTLNPNASPERKKAVGRRFDARTEETVPGIDARLLSFPQDQGSLTRIKHALKENSAVESVDFNYVLEPAFVPNDPRFPEKAADPNQYGLRQVRFPGAWDRVMGNSSVDIAIVDTGIDTDHADLAAKITAQRDFTTSPEGKLAKDSAGHGTHVAGIAAAVTNNGKVIAGACPGCDLMVAKVVGDNGLASTSDAADAIVWAANNGAEVVNVSLGTTSGSDVLKNAVDYAWNHDVVVVAAVGNSGTGTREYPAAYANVIAVAGTGKDGLRASYSNYGDWVDVAAPGSGIVSTRLGGGYKTMTGTSMSTPHVAGLAGLLAAQGRSASGIRSRIQSTATDLGTGGKDDKYGYGRINAYSAVGG